MKGNTTLLIVDDDEDDRQLFVESAKEVDENICCLTASNGAEAMQLLKNKEIEKLPDFIFLDLRMPGLSGKKIVEKIKRDPELLHIPIIVFTTSREVKDANELIQIGASHFISKPVNPDEIYYLIAAVIEGKWDKPSVD